MPNEQTSLAQLDLEILAYIEKPSTSIWMRTAMKSALERDPVDAANDVEILTEFLVRRCNAVLNSR